MPAEPTSLTPEVASAVDAATVIVVATDDGSDAARARARQAATELAVRSGAALVLLDRTDTTYADTPRIFPLDREAAEGIGRSYLVDQIDEAAAAGVEATAFQHSLPGSEALTDTVREVGADLVVAPEDIDEPGLLDRLRQGTVEGRSVRAARSVPVVVVDEDGSLHLAG